MANRLKEDEKNERIIRGLLKLPANKKCINCNSLGPQYACTNFWTFICTNCSGIHREFTHRVKSISMAKFTSQEVTALQEGGNERAKEIYFKEWDPQCHSLPDSSNVERLRTFIKHVYVDRRYTGERTADRPPRVKSDREGYEQRKTDDFRGASRSPPYDETYDRRYGERPGSGGRYDDRNFRQNYEDRRSPGYDQGDYRRSPRFDVVDDRRQDEKYGRVNQNQRFEDRRFSDGVRKPEGSSPNYQKDMGSPPVIRPVREILGDDAPTLRVGEPPKSNGGRVAEIPPPPHVVPPPEQVAPPLAQVTAPARSLSPTNGKPTEVKNAKADSLIDFDADPEPSVTEAPNQSVARQTTSPPANGDWASFDSVTEPKAPQVAASLNPLDSDLTLLSAFGDASGKNPSALSASGTDLSSINTAGQWPTAQQNQPALFSVAGSQATSPPFTPSSSGSQGSQSWAPSAAQNVSGSLTASAGQTSQSSNPPTIGTSSGVSPEVKHSGRKELPADLFAALYPTQHASMMGWQARPSFGMGFAMQMQYPPAVQQVAPPFQYPSKSANPFDTSNEPTLAHASTFPSLVPLQGALPNPPNSTGLLRSSSFGATPFSQMMPQHLPPNPLAGIPGGHIGQQFPSNIPQQIPSNMSQQFRSNIPQQIPSNMFAMGNQQIGMDHNSNARYSQPSIPSFPPAGGNPFG